MSSIKYFREFLTLSEYLNFSAAADSLYITQSALSKHISALEAALDVKLFNRTTQSVTLTPEGELFRQRIGMLVDDYDDICSCLRLLKSNFSGRLRIGCPYYALGDYLGDVPERFAGKYDDIKLLYSVGDPYEIMNMLIEKKVDLAIVPKYPMPNTGHLKCFDIYEERLGVLINADDPSAKKETLSLHDLEKYTFFSVGNTYFNASWHHTVRLCQNEGFTPSDPALFGQMEALIMGIRRGDGVTVIGQHMRSQASDRIAFRLLSEPECKRTISIWYDPENDNSAIRKFIKIYADQKNDAV